MTCKHAIIIVAGYGTRRLPITKAIEKCMLPVLNRPFVDYLVEDCLKAGVEHIIFVVSEGSRQIKDYYAHNLVLESYLTEHGKNDYLAMVTPPKNVSFEFVEQSNELLFHHYGTNTAVALARPKIPKGEAALVLFGDSMLLATDGTSLLKQLVAAVPEGESGAMTTEVPSEDLPRYGVLALRSDGYLERMVEKPSIAEAPSNFINLGENIFSSELLDETVVHFNDPIIPGQEKYVNIAPYERYFAKGGKMVVVPIKGKWLDVGTLPGWLHANEFAAREFGVE